MLCNCAATDQSNSTGQKGKRVQTGLFCLLIVLSLEHLTNSFVELPMITAVVSVLNPPAVIGLTIGVVRTRELIRK